MTDAVENKPTPLAAPPPAKTAKRIVLDKSRRDYATLTGIDQHGVAYTQVHKGQICYFDVDGEQVVAPEGWQTEINPPPRRRRVKPNGSVRRTTCRRKAGKAGGSDADAG
jgi:hypothetical protein